MALKYECDRCKTQFASYPSLASVTYPETDYYGNIADNNNSKIIKDLCPTCFRGLVEYLAPVPQGKVK